MYRPHCCFLGFPRLCKKGLQVHEGCSSFLECGAGQFRETTLFSLLTVRYVADSVTAIPALSFAYKFLPDFKTEETTKLVLGQAVLSRSYSHIVISKLDCIYN